MACATALTGTAAYHAPVTAAEKALDGYIIKAGNDPYVLNNLFHGTPLPDPSKAVDYTTMLTPALIAAMTKEQNAQLQQGCGGKYIDGQSCGINFNPIQCGQDESPAYLYDTLSNSPQTVTIASKWPDQSDIHTYRLVNSAGTWKIDGVSCAGTLSFNMP
jgi:hypothetical protein